MELPLEKNESDPRPESYKITDISKLQLIGEPVGTKQGWAERKQIIFGKNEIHYNLAALIAKANNNELSIAIFKPTELLEFVVNFLVIALNIIVLDRIEDLEPLRKQSNEIDNANSSYKAIVSVLIDKNKNFRKRCITVI